MATAGRCATIAKEIETNREMIEKEFAADAFSKLSFPRKAYQLTNEVTRSFMTAIDFAFGRQGMLGIITHPVKAGQAMMGAFKAFGSKEGAKQVETAIKERENYKNGVDAIAGIDKTVTEGMASQLLERYLENVPIVGKVFDKTIAASSRAYQAWAQGMKAGWLDALTYGLSKNGKLSEAEIRVLGNAVNVFAGQGNTASYGKAVESTLKATSDLFFAQRWLLSRFQVLTGQPLLHEIASGGESAARARKVVAQEYAKIGLAFTAVMGGAALMGLKPQLDPRSSDFGKIVVGNTRIDYSGGLAGVATFLSRIGTGSTVNAQGQSRSLWGPQPYGQQGGADVIGRFVRQKLAPIPGMALDLATGTNVMGQPVDRYYAGRLVTPLFLKDARDAMQDLGVPRGIGVSLLGLFGVGVNTYQQNQPRARRGY